MPKTNHFNQQSVGLLQMLQVYTLKVPLAASIEWPKRMDIPDTHTYVMDHKTLLSLSPQDTDKPKDTKA